MKKYSLISSDYVGTTKIEVLELCKNNVSLFESFVEEIKNDGNLINSFAGALRVIENSSNLISMPKNKFRLIEGHNLKCKFYEAKYGLIRIYLFHEDKTGRIIVAGGLKNAQEKDIKKVWNIIKEYQNEQ